VESVISVQLVEPRRAGNPDFCCSEAYSQKPAGGNIGLEPGLPGRAVLCRPGVVRRHFHGIGGTSGLDEVIMIRLGESCSGRQRECSLAELIALGWRVTEKLEGEVDPL
jgi:hypothetical protein